MCFLSTNTPTRGDDGGCAPGSKLSSSSCNGLVVMIGCSATTGGAACGAGTVEGGASGQRWQRRGRVQRWPDGGPERVAQEVRRMARWLLDMGEGGGMWVLLLLDMSEGGGMWMMLLLDMGEGGGCCRSQTGRKWGERGGEDSGMLRALEGMGGEGGLYEHVNTAVGSESQRSQHAADANATLAFARPCAAPLTRHHLSPRLRHRAGRLALTGHVGSYGRSALTHGGAPARPIKI